jgi:DNA invertase Pin-like site-specific DNA recombinase
MDKHAHEIQPSVALYARVSTAEQTLDSQLRDLREYCRMRGWEAVEYLDHGISGAKDSRPGWNACWDAIEKRKHSVLLVHALDRVGRSLPHLVKIISHMSERGLSLVSYRENIDLSTASGRMLAGIFSVLAEYERSIISERTKAGMRAAKARGSRIGNPKRFFDVKRASELRGAGWGQIRIARELGVGVGRVNAWSRNAGQSTPKSATGNLASQDA